MNQNTKKTLIYLIVFIALICIAILLLWLINPNYIKNNILLNKTIVTQTQKNIIDNKNITENSFQDMISGRLVSIDNEKIVLELTDKSKVTIGITKDTKYLKFDRNAKIDEQEIKTINYTTISKEDFKEKEFINVFLINNDINNMKAYAIIKSF